MQRLLTQGHAEAIAEALARLTPRMSGRIQHVDFLCGVNPAYVGLHEEGSYEFADGRVLPYSDLAHVTYAHHQGHLPSSDRRTTIVLPDMWKYEKNWVEIVSHEIGHCIHEVVGWDWLAEPVTEYAHENEWEAFAEAFEVWVNRWPIEWDRLQADDPATIALFDALS